VAVDGEVVARAAPKTIKVQRKQYHVNEEDFEDVLASGSNEAVLNYIQTKKDVI
jgi:hypothetical protein